MSGTDALFLPLITRPMVVKIVESDWEAVDIMKLAPTQFFNEFSPTAPLATLKTYTNHTRT